MTQRLDRKIKAIGRANQQALKGKVRIRCRICNEYQTRDSIIKCFHPAHDEPDLSTPVVWCCDDCFDEHI